MVLRILTEVIEISSTGLSPSLAGFPKTIRLSQLFVTSSWILTSTRKSYNTPATARQCCNIDRGLGFSAFAHRYSQNQFLSLFLRVIRCFNSPGIAPFRVVRVYLTGFSHSEINGSMLVYSSPLLIAANHVLLRLLVPWHPPYALIYLTILFSAHDKSCSYFTIFTCSSLPPASVQVDFFSYFCSRSFNKKNSHIINNNLYLYRLPIVSFISTFHESS